MNSAASMIRGGSTEVEPACVRVGLNKLSSSRMESPHLHELRRAGTWRSIPQLVQVRRSGK